MLSDQDGDSQFRGAIQKPAGGKWPIWEAHQPAERSIGLSGKGGKLQMDIYCTVLVWVSPSPNCLNSVYVAQRFFYLCFCLDIICCAS